MCVADFKGFTWSHTDKKLQYMFQIMLSVFYNLLSFFRRKDHRDEPAIAFVLNATMQFNHLEGIDHTKMKICWKITQPQAIKNVVRLLYQNRFGELYFTLFAHQWILCSECVPSEWESKQPITIVHKLSTLHVSICMFVINKSIIIS